MCFHGRTASTRGARPSEVAAAGATTAGPLIDDPSRRCRSHSPDWPTDPDVASKYSGPASESEEPTLGVPFLFSFLFSFLKNLTPTPFPRGRGASKRFSPLPSKRR